MPLGLSLRRRCLSDPFPRDRHTDLAGRPILTVTCSTAAKGSYAEAGRGIKAAGGD
jgi:hypothetical protein